MSELIMALLVYGAIIFAVALVANHYTKSGADFFLAGRKISGWLTALGAGASDMSSWLLMVLPGLVYVSGLNNIWMPIALSIGAYFNWRFVAKRLRIYTEIANNSLTLPSFIYNRFRGTEAGSSDRWLECISGLAMMIFFTIYTTSGFMAGAEVLRLVLHIPHQWALLLIVVVTLSYTLIGGFFAVSWVDFFQGGLMFFSLLIVPIVAVLHLGGLAQASHEIVAQLPAHLDIFHQISILSLLSLLGWGLGYFGQPHINVRFMAVRHVRELPLATRVCMTWMIISLCGAMLTGLLGRLYFHTPLLAQPETVFISLAHACFSPFVVGILVSAILSAVMSTVSAQMLMSASIFTEDFYLGFLRTGASAREELLVSRLSLFAFALLAFIIAALPNQSLFGSIGFAWSGLGASFGPVTVLSLYWRRMSRAGAIAGIATGAAVVLLWELRRFLAVGGLFNNPQVLPGFSMLPGVFFSFLSIIYFSRKYPPQADIVDQHFTEMQQRL